MSVKSERSLLPHEPAINSMNHRPATHLPSPKGDYSYPSTKSTPSVADLVLSLTAAAAKSIKHSVSGENQYAKEKPLL